MEDDTLILECSSDFSYSSQCSCKRCVPKTVINMEAPDGKMKAKFDEVLKASRNIISELAKAKKALLDGGVPLSQVNNKIREEHKKAGLVETIELDNLDPDANSAELEPTYQPNIFLTIPHDVAQTALAQLKQEPEEASPQTGKNSLGRWWQKQGADKSLLPEHVPTDTAQPPPQGGSGQTTGTSLAQAPPKRKKRLPPSREFIEVSETSSTLLPDQDQNPEAATALFKLFLMKQNRRSAFIAEVSHLDQRGGIIFGDSYDQEAREARNDFVAGVRKSMEDTALTAENESHMNQLLQILSTNPETFFHVNALILSLQKTGVTDPNVLASRVIFDGDEGRAIITDQVEEHDDSRVIEKATLLNKSVVAMIRSFDSAETSNTLSSTFISSTRSYSSCTSATSFDRVTHSTPNMQGGNAFNFEATTIHPRNTCSDETLSGTRLQSFTNHKGSPGKDGPSIDPQTGAEWDEAGFLKLHKKAEETIKTIQKVPFQGRKPVHAWKTLISKKEIEPPKNIMYHLRYSSRPSFLNLSFCNEALPGVFRACTSGWSEEQAMEEFKKVHKRDPDTLIELNAWTKRVHPPIVPKFDHNKHPIEVPEYNLQFCGEIDSYQLARAGASLNPSNRIPHCPRNMVTSRRFFSLHQSLLGPLEPFIANPLLCTMGPSLENRARLHGYSIHVPHLGGDLVMKPYLFEHNALSFPILSAKSMIGRCAVCTGLLALPDFVTYLSYFWPDGLQADQVTPSMKEVWRSQDIPVCYIHVLTDGKLIKGRDIMN